MIRTFLTALVVLLGATAVCPADTQAPAPPQSAVAATNHPVVVMQVEHAGAPLGQITIELYPEDAPISVANFLKLVNNKFYDGLTFHRIAELMGNTGKIVQGGDPSGNGTGGPGWTIKGEFSANGVSNPLTHDAGAVAMARSSDFNSAGSQFYICVDPVHFLDNNYAVFGKVIDGLKVADQIQMGDKMTSVTVLSNPSTVATAIGAPPVQPSAPTAPVAPLPPPAPNTTVSLAGAPNSGTLSLIHAPNQAAKPGRINHNANLISAAASGDLVALKHELAAGAKVNARDADGGTALMNAALNGHVECVKALVAAGADIHAVDSIGETAADCGASYPDVLNALRNTKPAKSAK